MAQVATQQQKPHAQKPGKPQQKPALQRLFERVIELRDRTALADKLVTAWHVHSPMSKHSEVLGTLHQCLDNAKDALAAAGEEVARLHQGKYTPPANIKVVSGAKYIQGAKVWFKPAILEAKHYGDFVEDKEDLNRLVVVKVSGERVQVAIGDIKGVNFGIYPRGQLTLVDPATKKGGK